MEYASIAEARDASGLRLVLTAGVPGPWGESAKAIFDHKGLEYLPVAQIGGDLNQELLDWTGQNSAPVAVYDKLPPVCHWLDLLMLAERLAPEKPLLPADENDRALVLGLSAELAGVDGFAWNRRLQMLAPGMQMPKPPEPILRMGQKYGFSEAALAAVPARLKAITELLDDRMQAQQSRGSDYLVGQQLTAVDIYWANFAGMIKPLPPGQNPMPDYMRNVYEMSDDATRACLTPALEAHRDRMYERHIRLPLTF